MQIKYSVTGDRRKALVAVMRDTLQDATRYLGAPSFAFQVGAYTVDKNGTVTCPEGTDEVQIEMLIRELAHDGFVANGEDKWQSPLNPKRSSRINRKKKHLTQPNPTALRSSCRRTV